MQKQELSVSHYFSQLASSARLNGVFLTFFIRNMTSFFELPCAHSGYIILLPIFILALPTPLWSLYLSYFPYCSLKGYESISVVDRYVPKLLWNMKQFWKRRPPKIAPKMQFVKHLFLGGSIERLNFLGWSSSIAQSQSMCGCFFCMDTYFSVNIAERGNLLYKSKTGRIKNDIIGIFSLLWDIQEL